MIEAVVRWLLNGQVVTATTVTKISAEGLF